MSIYLKRICTERMWWFIATKYQFQLTTLNFLLALKYGTGSELKWENATICYLSKNLKKVPGNGSQSGSDLTAVKYYSYKNF